MSGLMYALIVAASIAVHLPLSDNQLIDVVEERTGLKAEKTDNGVYIFLPSTHYALGQYEVSSKDLIALSAVADVLNLNGVRSRYLYVEGHTDASGSETYNLVLSQLRADAVLEKMKDYGVKADRMLSVGYGSKYQAFTEAAMNRRVQLLIYTK